MKGIFGKVERDERVVAVLVGRVVASGEGVLLTPFQRILPKAKKRNSQMMKKLQF